MGGGTPRRIGVLGLPPYGLLSIAAVVDALLAANDCLERAAYAPVLLHAPSSGATNRGAGPAPALDGLATTATPAAHRYLAAASTLADAGPLDGAFVVTDALPDDAARTDGIDAFLRELAGTGRLLGGVGTGAAWLARAGVLRGHRCTLDWAQVAQLAERHPDVVVSSHVYEIDRQRLTCAGGTAALDLMIAWLGRVHGERLAQSLAARFGLERVRAHDERQRAPSAARFAGSAKLVEAVALMEANVAEPLNTDDIARLVGVSRRQLERLFRQHLGAMPSRWYLDLRLEHARRLLQQGSRSILQVGLSCGFSSAPHFSNAYRNRFGRTPRDERSARAAAWREARPDAPGDSPDEDPR
jgi:transcriptional regulator GlxA family with amidase domain